MFLSIPCNDKLLEKARTAISRYLQEGKEIDSGIRRMARLDPEFLPEAATTSRDLALHFLTSREGNIMCGYHSFKNKATYIRDGWGKPKMKVRLCEEYLGSVKLQLQNKRQKNITQKASEAVVA